MLLKNGFSLSVVKLMSNFKKNSQKVSLLLVLEGVSASYVKSSDQGLSFSLIYSAFSTVWPCFCPRCCENITLFL